VRSVRCHSGSGKKQEQHFTTIVTTDKSYD
jgi:hypothetical protein